MGRLKANITMSLDGFVAGPNQSEREPLGIGGMDLHQWLFPLKAFRETHGEEGGEVNASTPIAEEILGNVGATIMGGTCSAAAPDHGETIPGTAIGAGSPLHHPVFVLTRYAREPLEMQGGTTFHFVTDGIESALAQARAPAGGEDVSLEGGASVCSSISRPGCSMGFLSRWCRSSSAAAARGCSTTSASPSRDFGRLIRTSRSARRERDGET